MKILALILSTLLLAACGGGGGSSSPSVGTNPSSPATPEQLALMVDSLGRAVPEIDFGGGDSGASGADGSAGDGKPIPNAKVTLLDNAGHTATATTDALGYYRVSVKGFTPPFIAKVVRADGSAWYSPSITPVKVRGFVTVNLTGLTDKLASDVATAAGVSGGAAQLTATTLAANTAALQTAKTNLNTQLAVKITTAGLNPATFDPVTTPYKAVLADSYDKLLESVVITKDAGGLTSVTSTATSIPGTWVGTYSNTGAGGGTGTTTLTFGQTGNAVTGGGTVCGSGNTGCGTATVINATASSSSSFSGVMSMVGGACTSTSNFSASVNGSQMTATYSSSNCQGVPFTGTWTVQKSLDGAAPVASVVGPTIQSLNFTSGVAAKLEVAFDTDMGPGYSTTGTYSPSRSYWATPRLFVVEFNSYVSGGSITLVKGGSGGSFVSTGGVGMAADRVFVFP